jgi:membrane protease YdiL (CAAX protease family)
MLFCLFPCFRYYFCRVPTPVAVIISAAVFALAHLTPGEFPQLFVLGNMFTLYIHSNDECVWDHRVFKFPWSHCKVYKVLEYRTYCSQIHIKFVHLLWRNQQYLVIPAGTTLGFSYAQTRNLLTPIQQFLTHEHKRLGNLIFIFFLPIKWISLFYN